MTLKKATAILSVVLCGCLLSGCNNSTASASSSTSPPSTSDDESSSAATSASDPYKDEESTSVVPSSILPPTEEPNTPDSSEPIASPAESEQEYTDLSFLSEEQRQLYTNAYDASFGLYGEGANLMDQWGYKVVTDGSDSVPFIEDHYTLYDVSFDEFSERINQFLRKGNGTHSRYARAIDYRRHHPLNDFENSQHQIQAVGHNRFGKSKADKQFDGLFGAFGLHEGAAGLDHTGCEEEYQQPAANGLQRPVDAHHHGPYLASLEGLRTLGQQLPDLSQFVIPSGQGGI